MKDLLPLLSTILGGVIALVGGVVTAILIHKYSASREKKKLLIEKAEFIYQMILKLDHFASSVKNNIMRENPEGSVLKESVLSQYEYQEITMLVGIYFPSLKELASDYIEKLEENLFCYGECLRDYAEEDKSPSADQKENICLVKDEYDVISELFKESLIGKINISKSE